MSAFLELVEATESGRRAPGGLDRAECVRATRAFIANRREEIRQRHESGESGMNVVHLLSDAADTVLSGALRFALRAVSVEDSLLSRVSLCALGGYGRRELAPCSDIDVCLLHEAPMPPRLDELNRFLVPFLWDIGFQVGYATYTVEESAALAKEDVKVFTSLMESRLVAGDGTAFARLKLLVRELQSKEFSTAVIRHKLGERYEQLEPSWQDLFEAEPNIKENAGGLRDYQTALWLLMVAYSVESLDEAVSRDVITSDEQLHFAEALDFLMRIRNELHFHTGTRQDRFTFPYQAHVASAFGYRERGHRQVANLMQDYYAAAGRLRSFLDIAARLCCGAGTGPKPSSRKPKDPFEVRHGELYAGGGDAGWFHRNSPRLMEVFWNCARRGVSLSRQTERLVTASLDCVNDTFRSNDLVRRFFVAICSRPAEAGRVLRQAAQTGLLGAYVPEFGAVQGVLRYEDFHQYPVDEHTLRALEALASLDTIGGAIGRCLRQAFENLHDPYVLVIAILCHDLGKADQDVHVEESVRLAEDFMERIGLPEDDRERVRFLVEHHMLMNTISQYRDIDDDDIVEAFAATVQTEEHLRHLLLLSYADLMAVGPTVWTEWKGALLMALYLRTARRLLGRVESVEEEYWRSAKADEVRESVPAGLACRVDDHLRGLGQRYFIAFSPAALAIHIEMATAAEEKGLVLHCDHEPETGVTHLAFCTRDRKGLFADIAGVLCSELIDVNWAALFTHPAGFVVDCFTVSDARQQRCLAGGQVASLERLLRGVLVEGADVEAMVDQARRRLFGLLQARCSTPTRIRFDNESSKTHTVIDVETGDRTGLLYDVAHAMTEAGMDIATARIVTDAHRVRDSFYVTLDGDRIVDESQQGRLADRIRDAIQPPSAVTTEGGAP